MVSASAGAAIGAVMTSARAMAGLGAATVIEMWSVDDSPELSVTITVALNAPPLIDTLLVAAVLIVRSTACGVSGTALATVPEHDYTIPFGQSRIWREGSDLTLVGLGLTVHNSLQAAEQLAAEGISAEVLDLRSVVPLDRDGVFRSVAKTGRLVVADEDYLSFGVTSEVLAVIAERDPAVLKSPAVRVAYPDVPVPFSRPMEDFCLPSVERILAAARATMKGRKR